MELIEFNGFWVIGVDEILGFFFVFKGLLMNLSLLEEDLCDIECVWDVIVVMGVFDIG